MANTTVNIDIEVQSKSLVQLEEELAGINAELKKVPIGSDAFKELSKDAQKVTSELDKVNNEIKGFTFDDKIRSADGAVKLLGGSLAATVGTLGVLGVESEAFGEFEKKAASAIAVAVGFKDVSEGISQLGPFLKQAGSAVKGFSITTKQALIATGVGIFVVALGTIVAYWDDITKAVTKFGEKVPFVGKAIEGIKNAFDSIIEAARPVLEFLGILPDAAEQAIIATTKANEALIQTQSRELKLAQARGASAKELYEIQKSILEAELQNLKNAEADKQEIYDKETELLALGLAEEKRIADEKQKVRDENAAKAKEDALKAEELAKENAEKLADLKAEIAAAEVNTVEEIRAKELEDTKLYYDNLITQAIEAGLSTEELVRTQEEVLNSIRQEYREEDAANAKAAADKKAQDIADAAAKEAEAIAKQEEVKQFALEAGLYALRSLAGESRGLAIASVLAEQAASIGQIVSATGVANAKAVAAFPLTLGQPWVTINSVAAGASIFASIQQARKSIQDIKNSQGGGSPTTGQIPRGGSAGAPQGMSLRGIEDVQGAQAPELTAIQPTVRAYVVSGDVTSSQEAEAKLNNKRTLGS